MNLKKEGFKVVLLFIYMVIDRMENVCGVIGEMMIMDEVRMPMDEDKLMMIMD
jgi:hypothetical protein